MFRLYRPSYHETAVQLSFPVRVGVVSRIFRTLMTQQSHRVRLKGR